MDVFNKVFEQGIESVNNVNINKLADMIYKLDANKATALRGAWATEEGKRIARAMARSWTDQEKETVSMTYKKNYEEISKMEKDGVGKSLKRLHLGARLLHDMKQIS